MLVPYRLDHCGPLGRPTRLLRKGRVGTHVVHFPSLKLGGVVVCESRLEADFALGLEFDHRVLTYRSQPDPVDVVVDGVSHLYTPDFEVQYRDGVCMYEIKPDFVGEDRDRMRMFDAVELRLRRRGVAFAVRFSREIRREPRLSIQKLLYARAHVVSRVKVECLREQISLVPGQVSWGALCEGLGSRDVSALAHLIIDGQLSIDWTLPFSQATVVHRVKRDQL